MNRGDVRKGGQTLPLFAIIVPGLLALMALGLDGAQIFLERRDAQGAADLAAVAGAKQLPASKADANAEAELVGQANGYTAAEVIPNADYGSDTQIEVVITTNVTPFFMPILDFFTPGDYSTVPVSARAVAQSEPGSTGSGNFALYALEPCGETEDFSALNWSGNSNEVVGAAHSNAGALISGNDQAIGPGGLSVTCVGTSGSPSELQITDKFPYNEGGTNPDLPDGGSDNGFVPSDCQPGEPGDGEVCRQIIPPPPIPWATYDAGTGLFSQTSADTTAMTNACDRTFSGDKDLETSDVTEAGVYCALNGKMVIKSGTYPHDVTLIAESFDIGDDDVTMSAHLNGILMYATTTSSGVGIDNSGSNSVYTGIMYSPFRESKVQFQGDGNELTGALVGYRVDYSGNTNKIIGDFGSAASSPPTVAIIE